MSPKTLAIVVVLNCLIVGVEMFGIESGPFRVVLQRLQACEDENLKLIQFGTRISSLGEGRYTYTGYLNFSVSWDENLAIKAELQQLKNGRYQPSFVNQMFKDCEEFMMLGKELATSILAAADYEFKGCPLPKGSYFVKDWVLDFQLRAIPFMVYGSYKLTITFIRGGSTVGCIKAYIDVVPKRKMRGYLTYLKQL